MRYRSGRGGITFFLFAQYLQSVLKTAHLVGFPKFFLTYYSLKRALIIFMNIRSCSNGQWLHATLTRLFTLQPCLTNLNFSRNKLLSSLVLSFTRPSDKKAVNILMSWTVHFLSRTMVLVRSDTTRGSFFAWYVGIVFTAWLGCSPFHGWLSRSEPTVYQSILEHHRSRWDFHYLFFSPA